MEAEEKSRMSRDLLSELGLGNARTRISIHPPTLTGQSFSALGAMMMKSSSFELIGKLFLMYMLSIFRIFLNTYLRLGVYNTNVPSMIKVPDDKRFRSCSI